ncbi:hypothetical protein Tco_1053732 [Tanacetum coccineum]|uniref:CCHC-type domain-containing protein n=1 Tax=Tanacetum coccineum TaxID=301880 RepID=A0ABQ5GVF6_9ASTR
MSSFNQRGCFGCGGPLDGLLCRRYTCEWCGNNLRNGFCSICDSGAGNSFVYHPYLNSFNDPLNFINHHPQPQFKSYSCELCGKDSHYGYDCPPRVPLYQPRNQNFYEPNLFYNSNSSGFDQPPQYSIDHRPQSFRDDLNQQRMNDVHNEWINNDMIESRNELLKTMQSLDDDDDDEESTIPLNEIISQIPPSIAITPVLSTMEPKDYLIIGDEDLSTIPEKESDEVIKSSVEDLFPIPSESEDTSDNDSECYLPFCDDSPPLDILEDNSVTFSNPLFDVNDDLTSSNDESLPEEDIQEENFKIYSNPLFEFDDKYISTLLVTPLFNANEDECFDPGGDINEIGAFLNIDVSMDIEDGYHDSERDIIYLESLLINDTIPNLPPKVFLDRDPKSVNDEPKIDDLKIKENVRFTFEDRHYLSLTIGIKIFLPFLTYLVNSLPLLSSGSEDTIFDPGISAYSFYSLESVAYESPMMIFPFFCFCPKDKGIRGEIASDYEDSRARGFVYRSLELLSFACLYMRI